MYIRRFSIENVRTLSRFDMVFERGSEAGWHVILGTNGSGKSSVVRSFALLVMGEREAYAARQDFNRWISVGENEARVSGTFQMHEDFDSLVGGGQPPTKLINADVRINRNPAGFPTGTEITYSGERVSRTLWGGGAGWFAASFGPFRRFTGGDRIYDRLFVSNRRLAPHLTALGEDVALTEAIGWLTSLHIQALQDERSSSFQKSNSRQALDAIVEFINLTSFFPHGAKIDEVVNDNIYIVDGAENIVPIDQLSDGYRSALSLVLELIRQMFELYGFGPALSIMQSAGGGIRAPGVVVIDEIDAHLHPTWQRDIGRWLRRAFPQVQFIVTTHSPIICRAVADDSGTISGSIWRLPAPGGHGEVERIQGDDLRQLAYGDILDAYGTQLFGVDISISPAGEHMRERLAELNAIALVRELSDVERKERRILRSTFPAEAGARDV